MSAPSRHRPILVFTLALVVLATLVWSSAAAAQPAGPSLRLIGPSRDLTLPRVKGKVSLNVRTWVASTGGDFEVRVARPDYDSPAGIVQVDSVTGAVLRGLPDDTLDGWFGFSHFIEVVVTDSTGQEVARGSFTFCPNSFQHQRVDDSGPEVERYPTFCYSFSPFTKGMVWGIEQGWATRALGDGDFGTPRLHVPRAGEFMLTVRIADRYQDLLEVSAADGEVTVPVTIKNVKRRTPGIPIPVERAARAVQSAPVPTVTDPDPSTMPDLVALPLWSMETFHRQDKDVLAFAATPWNAGPAPLVVEGFRRPGEEVMDAFQYFRDEDGDVVGRAPVGEMRFHAHPGHNHWHFLQFALFTLHDVADEELVRSRKQSYRLAPTDSIDLTVDRAWWGAGETLFTACGERDALWVREVLQTGWGDTYFQFLPGQSFNITNLPNGWYTTRIQVNPLRSLFETDFSNNVEERLVFLGGRKGHRTVLVAPWHGIEE